MLNHLVCGNFNHLEEDDIPCSSPTRKTTKRKENNKNKNPYSSRGLDKFSTLLADLDQKRKKVYSQMNPHDISFVRFTYSNTDVVPIVVKVKNNKDQKKHKSEELKVRHFTTLSESTDQKISVEEERKQPKLESKSYCDDLKIDAFGFSWNMLKRPSFYLPVVMILILVFLTVFGRSVATLCTCVLWYIFPLLKDGSNSKPLMKKKDYVRGFSEKKMVMNEGLSGDSISGDSIIKISGKHSHQKSW